MLKFRSFIFLLILLVFNGYGQTISVIKKNYFFESVQITINTNSTIKYSLPKYTSGFTLIKRNSQRFSQEAYRLGNHSTFFSKDPHSVFINKITSELVTIDTNIHTLELFNLDKEQIYELHIYKAGESIKEEPHSIFFKDTRCELPNVISQKQWRNEPTVLPPPVVIPTETRVQHVIVHHAAGSNTNTNYQDVVRNIYLLHTQTNGWDDIGYNFLIAQDGTIFLGRDSQGYFDHDNVRGAHMCNKNNGTMAICLLGNYELVEPPQVMLQSLSQLISWKLNKELISPNDSTIHAIGPSSANLPDDFLGHIAGHQDGCASGYTRCPGKYVYNKLDSIKLDVSSRMVDCLVGVEEYVETDNIFLKFVNNTLSIQSLAKIEKIQVMTALGDVIFEGEQPQSNSIVLEPINTQCLLIRYYLNGNFYTKKILSSL